MLQIPALEQFHDDVGNAFVLAEIVNGNDVGVPEASRGGRLVSEPRKHPGVAVGDQSLDGDLAPYGRVEAAKDASETAVPKLGQDFVSADALRHV
jgi:hypothetical protein